MRRSSAASAALQRDQHSVWWTVRVPGPVCEAARAHHTGVVHMTTDIGGISQPSRAHRGEPGSGPAAKPPLRWVPGLLRHAQHQPPAGPAGTLAEGIPVTLRDGSRVMIRQLRGTDAPLLADGFT